MPARRALRSAFSLIEVLTVIGIIVVLATILLVALSAVSKQGGLVSSMANLQQTARWMQLYSSDHREFIVPSQFDYSGNPSPGKVRSAQHPDAAYGPPNTGTWTDILWTLYADTAFAGLSGVVGGEYNWRFDSPDKVLYETLDEDLANPFRSAMRNSRDVENGDVMLPFGSGARESDLPGFFAANQFFNADPNSPTLNGFWTTGQIRFPDQSMYAVDSFWGEVIEDDPEPFDTVTDSDDNGVPDTLQVDFRYQGVCLMLFLDGHVSPEGRWTDLDTLEESRPIRVRDLDKR